MSVQITNPAAFAQWIESKISNADGAVEAAAQRTVDYGLAAMQQATDRIDTGLMLGSTSRDVQSRGDNIVGRFGFLDRKEDYFAYQTVTGFTTLDGRYIAPTFALRDGFEFGKMVAEQALTDAARSL